MFAGDFCVLAAMWAFYFLYPILSCQKPSKGRAAAGIALVSIALHCWQVPEPSLDLAFLTTEVLPGYHSTRQNCKSGKTSCFMSFSLENHLTVGRMLVKWGCENHCWRGRWGAWSLGASRQLLAVCHVLLYFWWRLLLLTSFLPRSLGLKCRLLWDGLKFRSSVQPVASVHIRSSRSCELSNPSRLPNTESVLAFVHPFDKYKPCTLILCHMLFVALGVQWWRSQSVLNTGKKNVGRGMAGYVVSHLGFAVANVYLS